MAMDNRFIQSFIQFIMQYMSNRFMMIMTIFGDDNGGPLMASLIDRS